MDSQNVSCVICNQPVCLESAKTDDHGKPVHGECYAASLALNAALKNEAALNEAVRKDVSFGKPSRLPR